MSGRGLLIRLAVLGTALVAALGAYVVRSGAAEGVSRPYKQLNGSTGQGFPIWAVLRDGEVRTLYLAWRATCTHGATWGISARFLDRRYPWRRIGRTFSVTEHHFGPVSGAASSEVTLTASGKLATEGGSAWGTMHGRVAWDVEGRTVSVCDSGVVFWHVAAPH